MKHATMLVLSFLAVCALGQAGGSCDFYADIKPILMQEPKLGEHLIGTLDFYRTAAAARIGSNVNEELGGMRVGPYHVYARPKGATGPYPFEIEIKTENTFLDADGNKVPLEKASSVKQELKSVEITVAEEPFKPDE